jgi:hypothetical protein
MFEESVFMRISASERRLDGAVGSDACRAIRIKNSMSSSAQRRREKVIVESLHVNYLVRMW